MPFIFMSDDGDNLELTSEIDVCSECGETVTITIYASVDHVQEE